VSLAIRINDHAIAYMQIPVLSAVVSTDVSLAHGTSSAQIAVLAL
jgi:hypothetical protein